MSNFVTTWRGRPLEPDEIITFTGLEKMDMPTADKPLSVQVGGEHYKSLKIQPVEYIHANNIGWFEGSAIKYLTRWRNKGGLEDLRKAKHIIEMLIELEEQSGE